jgi:cell fate regulator YaaT (PSP1 superfamily)
MRLHYRIAVGDAIKLAALGEESLNLRKNDFCILRCPRHEDYGRVIAVGPIPAGLETTDLAEVKRQATLVDQGKAHENRVRSKGLHRTADELIRQHQLPMRLRSTHLTFDRALLILVYTAPGRVDFRALLKDLNKALNVRVELRQIGPRDQAAMVGGLGSCGRELCCSSFLTNFVSINIKMAKLQGISLNPSNIIGACGRLKCCLEYEYDGYRLLLRNLPRIGSRCQCQGCGGKVIDVNPLQQSVRVVLDDDRVVTVPLDEVTVTTP